MKTTNPLLAKLRHHVTGAIERGEGVAIAGIPATNPTAAHTPGSMAEYLNLPEGWIATRFPCWTELENTKSICYPPQRVSIPVPDTAQSKDWWQEQARAAIARAKGR